MKLNKDKTSYMIFNFSQKYQFKTRLSLEGKAIEQVTKLFGLVLRDDLTGMSQLKTLCSCTFST